MKMTMMVNMNDDDSDDDDDDDDDEAEDDDDDGGEGSAINGDGDGDDKEDDDDDEGKCEDLPKLSGIDKLRQFGEAAASIENTLRLRRGKHNSIEARMCEYTRKHNY